MPSICRMPDSNARDTDSATTKEMLKVTDKLIRDRTSLKEGLWLRDLSKTCACKGFAQAGFSAFGDNFKEETFAKKRSPFAAMKTDGFGYQTFHFLASSWTIRSLKGRTWAVMIPSTMMGSASITRRASPSSLAVKTTIP